MPAVSRGFRAQNDVDSASTLNFGQINTTGFLFGDDDSERHSVRKEHNSTTSPDVKSYLQMNATDDKFPILVRRDDHPGLVSHRRPPSGTGARLLTDVCSSPHHRLRWTSRCRSPQDPKLNPAVGPISAVTAPLSTVSPQTTSLFSRPALR